MNTLITIFRRIAGAVLLALGIIALFTPLTPGGWLVFVGLELLGIHILSPYQLRDYKERLRAWGKAR